MWVSAKLCSGRGDLKVEKSILLVKFNKNITAQPLL